MTEQPGIRLCLTLLLAAVPWAGACSRDRDSPYDGDKNYGQGGGLAPVVGDQPDDDDGGGSSADWVPVSGGNQYRPPTYETATDTGTGTGGAGSDTETETETGTGTETTAGTGTGTGPDIGTGEEEEEPPPLPPETVISANWYQPWFDQESAQGIRDGSGYRSLGQIEARVRDKLWTDADDGVAISQTFGDGVSRSTNIQELALTAADEGRLEGRPTVSGRQRMDRVVTPACPTTMLCIERMVFEPQEGDIVTYCYTDATGAPAAFPYGPIPNYRATDWTGLFGDYGPFRVTKFAGDVACASPGSAELMHEDIQVKVEPEDAALVPFRFHTVEPWAVDHAVRFTTARVTDDLRSPYLDETVFLNHSQLYLLNEAEAEIVKMVVTTRMSIDVAAEAGGGLFGKMIANLLNIQGVIVDLHLEQCEDLLHAGAVRHCP